MDSNRYIDTPFSYSQLSTFKACSQKFKLTYLDGIRKPHESIEAFVGKRVQYGFNKSNENILKENYAYTFPKSLQNEKFKM